MSTNMLDFYVLHIRQNVGLSLECTDAVTAELCAVNRSDVLFMSSASEEMLHVPCRHVYLSLQPTSH